VERRVTWYTIALAVGAVLVGGAAFFLEPDPLGQPDWVWLAVLALGLAAAEHLRVRFRRGEHVDAITLFEAVLAPLIFAFSTPVVVGTVAVAQAITALVRRAALMKAAFNVAMWSLAAGVGSLVFTVLVDVSTVSLESLAYLTVALTAVAVVNNIAFTYVLALAGQQSFVSALRGLTPVIVPGWIGGWGVNLLMGLLFVMAYAGSPAAVVLFPVPLAMLHLAYRGYVSARADRLRLSGLREAAKVLSEPLDPRRAIAGFLREVARSFEARAAALVLHTEGGEHEAYVLVPGDGAAADQVAPREARQLEAHLADQPGPIRVTHTDGSRLALLLAKAGWRDCLGAPLISERRRIGAVVVFDQTGLESTAAADLVVLEALARETAQTIARGRLIERVLDERRKLDQIVSTASDGIFTLGEDGQVTTWNPACERITGLATGDVLGRTDALERLQAVTSSGAPVDVVRWAADPSLPRDVRITATDGTERRLSCSITPATGANGDTAAFVVVARDITPAEEYEELRTQFSELMQVQAAQRLVVEHLQRAVAPEAPVVEGADIAVTYLASDPSAPTGGDLYDWQLLPSGELHVAVVDAIGHGVAATKAALTVMHTLRFAALEGTELERLITRADQLLSAQEADLAATVVVARYHPSTGALRVASGGHPPALLVSTEGRVTQLATTGGALGWPGVGSDNVVTAHLAVGETLVLYTDGLIEARKDILEGMEELVRHAGEVSHLPAGQYANELVERALAGAERRDDSLALVIRRTHELSPVLPAQVPTESASG